MFPDDTKLALAQRQFVWQTGK